MAFNEDNSHFKMPAKRLVWHKMPDGSPGIIFASNLRVPGDRIVDIGKILFFVS